MQYTKLGKTNLSVSRVGFGAWGIGGGAPTLRWKDMWKAEDSISQESLRTAYKEGVNFFDTALAYADGHSERLIAETLGGKDIIIATKVPPLDGHWPARDKNIDNVFPKEYILQKARESYKNLGGRTIDILQLHVWLDDWFATSSWREAFAELKKEGVARYFGVSINDHQPDSALRLVESGEIDTIQVIYNIFDQSPRDTLFPVARKRNIGIIARVPLDEGSLGGALRETTTFNDWRKGYFTPGRLKEVVARVNRLKERLVTPERTLAQIALHFCTIDDGADTAIVGMRDPIHTRENVRSASVRLTESERAFLHTQRWIRNFYPEDI